MIIEVSKNHNLQAKKFDYVRIAYILNHIGEPIPASQINYYFNQIFPQTYSNSRRISMLIRQHPNLFKKINPIKSSDPIEYSFSGTINLNKTTKLNWKLRSSPYFRTP